TSLARSQTSEAGGRRPRLSGPRETRPESEDPSAKEKTHDDQDPDSDLRPPPRVGCRPDPRAEHGSLGIGVLRARPSTPCDEGVLRIHWRRRLILYDHVLEPREDRGRLEGPLRPTGGYSGGLA